MRFTSTAVQQALRRNLLLGRLLASIALHLTVDAAALAIIRLSIDAP